MPLLIGPARITVYKCCSCGLPIAVQCSVALSVRPNWRRSRVKLPMPISTSDCHWESPWAAAGTVVAVAVGVLAWLGFALWLHGMLIGVKPFG